jgi:alkylhydroperoxidase family enzyme
VELGRALGLTDEQIADLETDAWRENDVFSEKDKAVIHWADAVTKMTAPRDDAGFARLREHFTDAEILELTYTSGLWNCSNRVAEALHLVVEPPGRRVEWEKDEG